MNLYTLNKKELKSKAKEFNKTAIGAKYKAWSMLPYYICVLILICMIIGLIREISTLFFLLYFLAFTIAFSSYIISQMLYGKALSDYIKTTKK